jgi:hypothetical protein
LPLPMVAWVVYRVAELVRGSARIPEWRIALSIPA